AFIEYNPKTETNAIMLTLVSNFSQCCKDERNDICRSGSMSGGPIRRASQALQLTALPHIENIQADYGGTEIKNVLKWSVKNTRNDMSISVFLLTDGIGSYVSHHLESQLLELGKVTHNLSPMKNEWIKKLLEWSRMQLKMPPNSIPAIYLGVRVIFYVFLAKDVKPKNAITLSAQSLDGPIKLNVKVDPVTLWDRKYIPWLLRD
ncbi:11814_t:CDS:2, partial [Ambispora leptoticha]